jgi:hypothetical protein
MEISAVFCVVGKKAAHRKSGARSANLQSSRLRFRIQEGLENDMVARWHVGVPTKRLCGDARSEGDA